MVPDIILCKQTHKRTGSGGCWCRSSDSNHQRRVGHYCTNTDMISGGIHTTRHVPRKTHSHNLRLHARISWTHNLLTMLKNIDNHIFTSQGKNSRETYVCRLGCPRARYDRSVHRRHLRTSGTKHHRARNN